MALTDPNVIAAALALLVAQSEAVPTPSLAFAPREADPVLPTSGFGLGVGRECPTEVDRGLLEHLRGDLMPPRQARDLLGDGAVRGGDEHAPGGLAALPAVVGIDQVESRPRYPDLWVGALGGKGVGDQLKALVVGNLDAPACRASIIACAGVGASANRKVVCRMAPRIVPGGRDSREHAFEFARLPRQRYPASGR